MGMKYSLSFICLIIFYFLYMDISPDLSELINNIKADHAIIINDTVTEANLPPLLIYQNTRVLSQEEFTSMMFARLAQKAAVCKDLKDRNTEQKTALEHLAGRVYFMQSYSLMWCPVYKAASTNWCRNMITLAKLGQKGEEQLERRFPGQVNQQAEEVAPHLGRDQLTLVEGDNSKKMLIVRHPFDRLVSAFRDKFERCMREDSDCTKRSDWYYKKRTEIVSKYRIRAQDKFGMDYFSEKNNLGTPFPSKKRTSSKLPIWWEFVQDVLNSPPETYDEHYQPIYLFCELCSFDYNYIIHFENIENEEPHLVQDLNATGLLTSRWENSNGMNISRENVVETYFKLLTDDEIQKLYEIYEPDFLLFEYQFELRGLKYNVPKYQHKVEQEALHQEPASSFGSNIKNV